MRSLYWKIFLSFWLATILIIISTAWITGEIAKKSSIPARDWIFMDSYATAAVVTLESSKTSKPLLNWLQVADKKRQTKFYLIASNGKIYAHAEILDKIRDIANDFFSPYLNSGVYKKGNLIVSHEIISTKGNSYRLAAVSNKPPSHHLKLSWAGLTIRLIVAVFISGLICYILSIYLTHPLRALRHAAKDIATGKFNTRIGKLKGHYKDEISELSGEFDKMAETLETLTNSRERLLQDISHELRSPLARIHIALELAKNKVGNISEFDRIELEAQRLNSLIGEILDFARLNHRNTSIAYQEIDLRQILTSLINDANFEYGSKKVQLSVAAENNIVSGDAKLLHRAVENLIRNALHYSYEKSLINVCVKNTSKRAVIKIVDFGPGIPKQQLKEIFTPFYRVDISRAKKTGGYGLGLAIVAQIIQLHHGKIRMTNHKKSGLIVCIFIPKKSF